MKKKVDEEKEDEKVEDEKIGGGGGGVRKSVKRRDGCSIWGYLLRRSLLTPLADPPSCLTINIQPVPPDPLTKKRVVVFYRESAAPHFSLAAALQDDQLC